MGKNKYIESPEKMLKVLSPEKEFELPLKKLSDGFYQAFPNKKHIAGKNNLRKIASTKTKIGYVYLIRIQDTNHYKIGVSTNPKRRLADISSIIPYRLELLALNKINNHYIVEQEIIDIFKSKLIKNEWFDLSINDAKHIMITLHNKQVEENVST